MAREVGIPGDGPTTVASQTGELQDIVQYITDADMQVKREFQDWNFMWTSTTDTSSVGSNNLTTGSPSDLGVWNREGIVYNYDTDDWHEMEYVEWDEYKDMYKFGTHSNGPPELFTIMPDKTIQIYPPAESSKNIYLEYWKKPEEMTADSDVSDIPAEFHRIIIVRAKMYYAAHEDAPEVMVDASAEYITLLDALSAAYGRGQDSRRMHKAMGDMRVEVI